ncbi:MAG: DUF3726 domain-containing protein [Pseudomonadota bacterium]
MRLSPGEVTKLALTAMRGAGASWGTAEEAGQAVHWLEMRGEPGAAALADLLDKWPGEDVFLTHRTDGPVLSGPSGRLCPIRAGMTLTDHRALSNWAQVTLDGLATPLLLAPFSHRAGYRREGCRLSRATPADWPAGSAHPRIDALVISRLQAHARETYVPASAASRQAGAGAGSHDND